MRSSRALGVRMGGEGGEGGGEGGGGRLGVPTGGLGGDGGGALIEGCFWFLLRSYDALDVSVEHVLKPATGFAQQTYVYITVTIACNGNSHTVA